MVKIMVGVRNVHAICGNVLLHHIPRAARQADALALADRIEPEAAMLGEGFSGFQFDDLAGAFAQVMTDEFRVPDLAEKADSLAVFAVAIGQIEFARQPPHVVLPQMTDRKPQSAKLTLIERAKEVGLVFDRIR